MKKILAFCLMLSCFASFADVEDDILSTLSAINANISRLSGTLNSFKSQESTNQQFLRGMYLIFGSNADQVDLNNDPSNPYNVPTFPCLIRSLVEGFDNLRIQGDVSTNELIAIDTAMQSNIVMMAQLKAEFSRLTAIAPIVESISSDLSRLNQMLTNCYISLQASYNYLRNIYDLLYRDLSLIQQQLYSIYDKIGDVTFDMTNALNVILKGGIGINGIVQVSLTGPDGQPFELPDYLYNWYTSDTYIQGNEYTGYYQPLMSLSGSFYGRQFERWNKDYSQNPLNFFLSRQQDITPNADYNGIDGWYNALIRMVDNNGQILEANNSLLAFIAAKLSESNDVSIWELQNEAVNAAASGSGFNTSFNLNTPDLDNPLPNWSGSSLPENVYFGTLYFGERQIVFSVPTSEFAVFFTLIRTGFQLTYWGLVLAFFWFAFRVLRWVCPYLAAVVHWLLQFN